MNPRDRLMKAIEFNGPDRIPIITWRAEGYREWLRFGDHEVHRPAIEALQCNYPCDAFYPDTPWIGGGAVAPKIGEVAFDEWGIGWARMQQGCIESVHPLLDWSSLDSLVFPNPAFYIPPGIADEINESHGERYVYVGTFGGFFQHMASLRGYENMMIDLARDAPELHVLADRLLDYFLQLIDAWREIGVDGMFFGDDLGMQDRLIVRPAMWRAFVKPRYQQMFDAVHRAGSHVWFHTDGYVMDIVEDLVEIGIDVLNVNQLALNGIESLGQRVGGRVCFMGGLDHQRILPFGTKAEVVEHVQQVIEHLAKRDGGYIAVPLSGGGYDTPITNLRAALDTFGEHGHHAR